MSDTPTSGRLLSGHADNGAGVCRLCGRTLYREDVQGGWNLVDENGTRECPDSLGGPHEAEGRVSSPDLLACGHDYQGQSVTQGVPTTWCAECRAWVRRHPDPDAGERGQAPHCGCGEAFCSLCNARRRSRFDPSVEQMRAEVLKTNARAEHLAGRVGAARRAVLSGQPSEVLLAILDGKEPVDA